MVNQRFRQLLAIVAVVAMTLVMLSHVPIAQAADQSLAAVVEDAPETVTADALPTVQINGVVWDQVIVGNTVYVGGEFTDARPAGSAPGVNTTPRSNLLAYDIRTGELLTHFAPTLNGKVSDLAASPDGTKLGVVGTFTQVNGVNRYRSAVFNLPSGSLSNISAGLDAPAQSVAMTDTAMYVGGYFSTIGSVSRSRVGAISLSDGAVLPFAIPVDDRQVLSLTLSPDYRQIVLSGNFTSVGGSANPGYGLYRADATTGAGLPLPLNAVVRDAGDNAAILKLDTDETSFYGVGYRFGGDGGSTEGAFQGNWGDGTLVNIEDCHGDTYDIAPSGGVVYQVSHKHYCGNSGGFPQTDPWTLWHSTAWTKSTRGLNTADIYRYPDNPGSPRPGLLAWFPRTDVGTYTGKSQATWSVKANDEYVVVGGEFPKVNGQEQEGLVRYAVRSLAPNKQGPRLASGSAFTPTVKTLEPGRVRVSWPALWDRDDATLTYRVFRNDTNTLVYVGKQTNFQWNGKPMTFTDTAQPPGFAVRYLVRVLDPSGNVYSSGWTTPVTVGSVDTVGTYGSVVLGDNATKYWRLNETSGAAVGDSAGEDVGTAGAGVGLDAAGALLNSTDKAANFDGTSTAMVPSTDLVFSPDEFSQEVWFRTTKTSGRIAGFGDRQSGTSIINDRHLYLDAGRVYFGVLNGPSRATINSTRTLNDGQWHQAVATMGASGMALYIDGALVASRADVVSARSYAGYWRLGGDRPWAGDRNFSGTLDDYSIYPTALTARQVDNHWVASGRTTTLPPAALQSSSMTVQENTGSPSTLKVVRTGNTGDATSVSYARSAGTATPDADFTLAPGTLSFAPGEATKTIPFTIRDDTEREGAETVVVSLTAPATDTTPELRATATLTIAASDQQPDASISTASTSGFIGNDVYNATGSAQTKMLPARRGQTKNFYVRIHNDGNVTNSIAIKGSAAVSGSSVSYYSGTTNVTRAMRSASGWRTTLAPNAHRRLTVRITVLRRAAVRSLKPANVSGVWTGDGARTDLAKAVVKVAR